MEHPQATAPHSLGTNRPSRSLPPDACDAHMHIFDPRFAPSPHWTRTPPVAPVSAYRQLQARIGTSRTVVVTPSTYGTDNACTIDALRQLGEQARGVAVVNADELGDRLDEELDALARERVCGLRVNFVTPQSWGRTTPEMLNTLAARVQRLGWHIQVFAHAAQIVELAPHLARLPVPLVIDHLGKIDPSVGTASDAYDVIRRLLDGGNTWMKLSGAYMCSASGAPGYRDTVPVGRALAAAAPERMVWGSDWPHTAGAGDGVNDADLVDLLREWCGSDAVMDRVLTQNAAALYGF
ncbi:amidohydrolase family protein [Cupriavidus plantarum]|uniref:amidohydrolase family protein n=1 Tax=Cupriavidus plantarum TaxID=942865 RepID=UPI0015CE7382|nr:amidohydrolase family protein [Cupriavidus plantarum]